MNQQEFFIKYNGKFIDYDGAYENQCTDLVKQYLKEVLDIQPIPGNAIDYTKRPDFIKYNNNHPEPGDIIVFNYPPYGHTAIVNYWSGNQVGCFSQNDGLGSPCIFKDYPYKNVLGWIHPKPTKFTIPYTVFNGDPKTMEQARQLILSYSGGKIDCAFDYKSVPTQPGVFTTEQQIIFLKSHSTNQFVFYFYDSGIFHTEMATAEVPGTGKIMTCATPLEQNPMFIAYEFLNACFARINQFDTDIFTPDEAFIRAKFGRLNVDKLIATL